MTSYAISTVISASPENLSVPALLSGAISDTD